MARAGRTLRIVYASHEAFASEYASNVSNGGVFVPTDEAFAIRERVTVQLVLGYCQKRVSLAGEVVHCVTPEMATRGARAGVAVQFGVPVGRIRERFAPLVDEAAASEPADGAGRRYARRTKARLRARVHVAGDETRGLEDAEVHTRNLSTAGVLISSGSEPVPVGSTVMLRLSQAEGSELEVEGTVVRHVEAPSGRIAAFGVAFHVSAANRAEIGAFVDEVRAFAHSRRLGVISGPIEEVGLEALIRSFAGCAPRGTLTVYSETEEGVVALEGGALHGASLGGATGVKALARMLTWPEGRFEFRADIDASVAPQPSLPLDEALAEAKRFATPEASASALPKAVQTARLQLVSATGFEADKTQQAILDLAAVGMSVAKVFDVIPEPDATVSAVLRDLVDRGVIAFVA